jgi:hypothetical protein
MFIPMSASPSLRKLKTMGVIQRKRYHTHNITALRCTLIINSIFERSIRSRNIMDTVDSIVRSNWRSDQFRISLKLFWCFSMIFQPWPRESMVAIRTSPWWRSMPHVCRISMNRAIIEWSRSTSPRVIVNGIADFARTKGEVRKWKNKRTDTFPQLKQMTTASKNPTNNSKRAAV